MTTTDILTNAKRTEVFGSPLKPSQDADLRELQRVGVKIRFSRNETIFNEGDDAGYAYKVVSGAVRLCRHMINGRRQIADFLLPGELFGFLQFGAYTFTAEAVGDVVLMAYPQRQIERMMNSMPKMRERITVALSQQFLGLQDHLGMLARQSARERVAAFLLMLSDRAGARGDRAIDLPMSRQEIADYLGLTIETVCRALTDLRRSRILQTPDLHRVVVNKPSALEAAAWGEEQ